MGVVLLEGTRIEQRTTEYRNAIVTLFTEGGYVKQETPMMIAPFMARMVFFLSSVKSLNDIKKILEDAKNDDEVVRAYLYEEGTKLEVYVQFTGQRK